VRRGELLIRLDDDEVLAQLRGAETALSGAKIHEQRMVTLLSKGAATQSQLEAAQSQRALAEAQSAAARAGVDYTEIRAPFDAVVQSKRVQPGDLVTPGQPLLELTGGGLEIAVSVSEEEVREIHNGDRLQFEAADRRGEAEVIAIAPGGDAASHRGLLRARLREPAGLRSGSFARLQLPGRANVERGVQVPRSALVQRGDLTGVFVVQGGRVELRWLSLGAAEGDLIPVRAGVHAGELVVNPPGNLRDGQLVEVASAR
jgi:RND family efflux transporter MFP subunit